MSEPNKKLINAARRPGRPRGSKVGPRLSVSTWLPEPVADELIRVANRQGVSVGGLVRRIVILRLRENE